MILLCDVFVPGEPIGQGRISYGRTGHGYHANGRRLNPWRELIAAAVREGKHTSEPVAEAVRVWLTFWMPRPKRLTRPYPTVRPDGDHLERAVLDSLVMGGLLADDKFVVRCCWDQLYADAEQGPGVRIVVALRLDTPPD